MTKQQELELVRALADRLGPDSYCGPWLASVLPEVEWEMRNDYPPSANWANSRKAAEAAAENIIAHAQNTAASLKLACDRECKELREKTRRAQARAIDALNQAANDINCGLL